MVSELPLQRVLAILRRRIWYVAALALLGAAAAVSYSLMSRSYEASADVLVTPVAGGDERYATLGLIRESADPTRDVETATRLAERHDVAAEAGRKLGSSEAPEVLLGRVAVNPVAQSNIVTITSRASSGPEAARVANAFADALIDVRTAEMRAQIDRAVRGLGAAADRLAAGGSETEADTLRRRAADYEALRATDDPTLRVISAAQPSTSPHAPSPLLVALIGALVGSLLGIAGILAWSALHPTLMTESELRSRIGLPVLARTPWVRRRSSSPLADGPRLPLQALPIVLADSPAVRRAQAWDTDTERRRARVIGFGALAAGTGTTTTVLELGMQLALEGESVLVVALGQNGAPDDVASYPQWGALHLLKRSAGHAAVPGDMARVVHEASSSYDLVLVDLPPFEAAGDALRIARLLDALVLVARLGRTDLESFANLVELLKAAGVEPVGVVLTDAARGKLLPGAGAPADPARLDEAPKKRLLPRAGPTRQ